MTDQHPITPPPELVEQWYNECPEANEASLPFVATQAARWGADQELEACCAIALSDPCCGTKFQRSNLVRHIKEERRPKRPGLKEQALDALRSIEANIPQSLKAFEDSCEHILRALEQLDD